MSFNPDKSKQAQEVLFSTKTKSVTHPPLLFNKFEVKLASAQKHLVLNLDSELLFNENIAEKYWSSS